MLDEGPSKLYDALSAILGLEELTQAQTTLADARKAREKAHKDASQQRDVILEKLHALDDLSSTSRIESSGPSVAALRSTIPGCIVISAV